jgi:hypothetical protein
VNRLNSADVGFWPVQEAVKAILLLQAVGADGKRQAALAEQSLASLLSVRCMRSLADSRAASLS